MRGGAARAPCWLCMGLLLAFAGGVRTARAGPWVAPGNVQLRQDVELLVDSGVLDVPITTWPIPWGELSGALARVDPDQFSAAQQLAYMRLLSGIRDVQQPRIRYGYHVKAAPGRPALRWFAATPRGKSAAGVSLSGYEGRLAFRLNFTAVYGGRDHQRGRLDGSYLSFTLGNWILSAGEINRWWGPGWSGSLILGTNSRPVPAVSISRNATEAFSLPILRWFGPWTIRAFAGRLEDDRFVAHPYLLGARVAFRPARGLEMGLSRTAQFGGSGRPSGGHCLAKTVFGSTNQGPGNGDCANQLSGFDLRYTIPATPASLYAQGIGEDEAGGLPTKYIELFGLSLGGGLGVDGGHYRAFLEYADTTAGALETPEPNVAYENSTYRTGYRFRGYDLGYPTDNDSRLWTLGLVLQGVNAGGMTFLLRHGTLNHDNTNAREPAGGNQIAPVRTALDEADVYYRPSFLHRHLKVGLGVTRRAPKGRSLDTGVHGEIVWRQAFGG